MPMKTLKEVIMDSLGERLREILAAARELVEQVESYTTRAGSRSMLLNAKERMKQVLMRASGRF